jgi:tetraacyldisaccharide 4'-kinase
VVVGADRVEAGRLAVREFAPDVIVCDDAFQHRQLKRDLDILAVHAVRGFGNGRLLPGGPLREPRQALERADLVVFTHAGRQSMESLRSLHRLDQNLPASGLALEPGGFVSYPDYTKTELAPDTPVVAACAIANPEGFYESCQAAGLRLVGTRAFPDHHRFTSRDLKQIEELSRGLRAAAVVVTEKDLVRLGEIDMGVRLLALRISGRWTDEASRVTMENLLAEKAGL